jgi:DNA-binding NarL/FixJ family response regulator
MRVALADDSVLLREGLARVLREHGFDVVTQVGTSDELLAAASAIDFDVAIIDIRMPPTWSDEGLIAAHELRIRRPGLGVLVLSQYVEPDYALRLLDGSAHGSGYLLKDSVIKISELADAIRRVAEGGSVVDPELVAHLIGGTREDDHVARLTRRERDVLALMAEGLTDRGIGERLFVTTKTVETHVRRIFAKLDLPHGAAANRRVHAVLTFLRARTP